MELTKLLYYLLCDKHKANVLDDPFYIWGKILLKQNVKLIMVYLYIALVCRFCDICLILVIVNKKIKTIKY